LAEVIPATVGAEEADAITSERIEKVKNVKKIGEMGS
jgi:hypothetical protein